MTVRAEWRVILLLLAGAGLLTVIVGVLVLCRAHVYAVRLIEQLRQFGIWGVLGLIGVQALVVIFVLPGIFFTVGAGFFFGPIVGSVCVVVGTTIGASCAFLIARHALGASAERFIQSRPRLQSLTREFTGEGWQLVLLTRLIPFFPFKLSNYFFGLSGFRFPGFVAGTAIGIIPITITNVYMGSIAADVTAVTAGNLTRTPLAWAVQLGGLAALAVFMVMVTRRARRALERARGDRSGESGEA